MDEETRRQREEAIFEAAYGLLAEHGYGGTSMLRVAKAAKASNETLYRWYGDKDGLFTAMVRENAARTRQVLVEALEADADAWTTLANVAPVFLHMILGDRAILLNRAAAADASGALGAALSAGGRGEVMPLMVQLMERICAKGDDAKTATEWFLGLLVGDLQIRRMIGQLGAPTEPEIALRCDGALQALRTLLERPHRL
jgi:AcrR family transcriptional regulator